MTNQEAKFILQAYRHNGADATDPQFAAALEQARRDPELAKWFEEERVFDGVISAKVKTVPVPRDLKANILASRKVIEPASFSPRRTWMAAAAVFFVLLGISALMFWKAADPQFATFRNDMAEFLTS